MLHPSYTDLMKAINGDMEEGDTPVVNSRYSIVLATSKRARQIIAGEEPLVDGKGKKPLSIAIQELESGLVNVVSEDEEGEQLEPEYLLDSELEAEEQAELEAEEAAGTDEAADSEE